MPTNRYISKEKEEQIIKMLTDFTDYDMVMLNETIDRLVQNCRLPFRGIESERGSIAVSIFEAVYNDREKILAKGITFGSYFSTVLRRCSFNALCDIYGVSPNDYNYYLKVDDIRVKYQIPLFKENAYKFSLLSGLSISKVLRAVEVDDILKSVSYEDYRDYSFLKNDIDDSFA